MHTFALTIRPVRDRHRVIAETTEPGLAVGTRGDEPFLLDVPSLPETKSGATRHDDLLAYGETVGRAAFVGRIGELFQEAIGRADAAGANLHVLLAVEDAELMPVRWERLCARMDGGWRFLRLQQRTPFSFYLPSENSKRYPAISKHDLRALVVVVNLGPTKPYGLANFDAAKTVASIRSALGEIPSTVLACDGVEMVPSADGLPTLDEICERITKERSSILHVVCHGLYRGSEQETFLFLRKAGRIDPLRPDDHVHRVAASEFIGRLRSLQAAGGLPHLTFLCSCETAVPEAEMVLGGLGQRLVRDLGMPAVVGMTEPVAIPLAERLSEKFYERLREHGAVDQGLSEASAGLTGHGHVLVPMLFSRLAGRKLFDDVGPLTVGHWEQGLRRLSELIVERAPVLKGQFDEIAERVRPALEIQRHSPGQQRADEVLTVAQVRLNELCQDFLEDSFNDLAKGQPLAVPEYDGRCPFPGLGVFDKVNGEDFRPFFFGREKLTDELRRLLEEHRFVAVLGGSGSGKSSLVRAGLLESLRKDRPDLLAIIFPPGNDPLARLETELITTPNPDVLVVDQFEELFTLCGDAELRGAFLEKLLSIRRDCLVVITMRADFLGECADHDALHDLLDAEEKHLKIIQPLRGSELRDVMERQANAVGLQFEPGLAQKIFEDIEGEPGAMPLLQHCLRQLWRFRHGRWLRLWRYMGEEDDHKAEKSSVGGVKGAISRTAEEVYWKLSRDQQELLPCAPGNV